MFDPFGDYATAGYLRNYLQEKDLDLIKQAEHELFRAQLSEAMDYLESRKRIEYADFLKVHQILFEGLYPWAGADRQQVAPQSAIRKGAVEFCHPADCQRAVQLGLSMAQEQQQMTARPGHIMGLFAYGHPFLDGNGRTMLVVHAELCYRANLSIDWASTRKADYLTALTREIEAPNAKHLDDYLRNFIGPKIGRDEWTAVITDLPGLDGNQAGQDISTPYSDPGVLERYHAFEQRRNYKL